MAWKGVLFAAVVAGPPAIRACRGTDADPYPSTAVPVREIAVGEVIRPEDLVHRHLPPVAIDRALDAEDELVGRVARERLLAGEPVREERLARGDGGTGIRALLPPGFVPLEVQGRPADADTLTAGVFVDLLVTEGQVTRTVLAGVAVVAVIPAHPDCDMGPTVVLAATPDVAQRLGALLARGRPTFVLRGDGDLLVR